VNVRLILLISQLSGILYPKMPPKKTTKKSPITTPIDTSKLSDEGATIVTTIIGYFEDLLTKKDREISQLKSTCISLEERVTRLEQGQDVAAAREGRENLILSGGIPNYSNGENTKKVLCNVLKNKINVGIREEDIAVAYRIGPKPDDEDTDKRSILFKLARTQGKYEIFNACKRNKHVCVESR